MDILNSEALLERFGGSWPAFHDAEIRSMALDAGERGGREPTMRLVIDADPFGEGLFVTLEFRGVSDLELVADEHLRQHVIFDLIFGDDDLVDLNASVGLCGSWRAKSLTVVAVARKGV